MKLSRKTDKQMPFYKEMAQSIKKTIRTTWQVLLFFIPLVFMIVAFEQYGSKGLWIVILIIIVAALLRIATSWNTFITGKHAIESAIWDKPLTQHTKEELKNKKVKIVWSKENGHKKKKPTKRKTKQKPKGRKSKKSKSSSK